MGAEKNTYINTGKHRHRMESRRRRFRFNIFHGPTMKLDSVAIPSRRKRKSTVTKQRPGHMANRQPELKKPNHLAQWARSKTATMHQPTDKKF